MGCGERDLQPTHEAVDGVFPRIRQTLSKDSKLQNELARGDNSALALTNERWQHAITQYSSKCRFFLLQKTRSLAPTY
jgi:hypothetical protein